MEDKERQELEDFSLEDIIREFSDHPVEIKQEMAAAQSGQMTLLPPDTPVPFD